MASNFPATLDRGDTTLRTDISSNDDLNTSGKEHDIQHVNSNDSSIEVQTKMGIGASNASAAAAGTVLTRTAVAGSTAWVAPAAPPAGIGILQVQVFS